MNTIDMLKVVSRAGNISDLHLTIHRPPVVRIDGQLEPWLGKIITCDDLQKVKKEILNEEQEKILLEEGNLDFSYTIPGVCRFRVNAYVQKGHLAFAFRTIPFEIMDLDELGLPQVIKDLSQGGNGLILITGSTGSGKSTTLAAILDLINREHCCHIITLEDPIEFVHHHNKSLIHQREIGTDTKDFSSALRFTLRQDPDVILVGEMRDLETISLALEAAETGHLVFGTLHTRDAPKSIDRILDAFPPEQQPQTRIQLSAVLEAVISQRLIPRKGGGRVAVFEILMVNTAVRNLIRGGKTFQLPSIMQLGGKEGMRTMDQDLARLINGGIILEEEGYKWAKDPDQLHRYISYDLKGREKGKLERVDGTYGRRLSLQT